MANILVPNKNLYVTKKLPEFFGSLDFLSSENWLTFTGPEFTHSAKI